MCRCVCCTLFSRLDSSFLLCDILKPVGFHIEGIHGLCCAFFTAPFRRRHLFCLHIMVGVARLELAASWSRTMRATICATPRCSFFIIMITHTVVKYQFSFLQRNMRNLSILVFGRNVSFCYFHLDSIPESHYNKTTAVSPVLQTLLTTSLETVHCCQSPFFFLSMLRKYKNAATFVAAFLWWTIQDSNL